MRMNPAHHEPGRYQGLGLKPEPSGRTLGSTPVLYSNPSYSAVAGFPTRTSDGTRHPVTVRKLDKSERIKLRQKRAA